LPASGLPRRPDSGKRRLRVGFVVDVYPALSETFILDQITAFHEAGHEVRVFCRSVTAGGGGSGAPVEVVVFDPPAGVRNRVAGLLDLLRSGRWRVARRAMRPGSFGRQAFTLAAVSLAKTFTETAIDVFLCHYGYNGGLVARLRSVGIVDAPIVTMFHGHDLRRASPRAMEELGPLQLDDGPLLAISGWSRRKLVAYGFAAERIVDQPLGVDPARFGRARPESSGQAGGLRVVTVGRLVREKGYDVALAAVAQLAERGVDVRYSIVGDGPLGPDLAAVAARFGIDDRVHFLGALPRDSVFEVLGASDVFLSASRDEVTPIAIMEASASGLPVVATRVGAVQELVEDGKTGILAPAGSVHDLAEAVERLSRDPDSRSEMGAMGCAKMLAERDADVLNARLLDLIEEVVT
jgi:colanic acid/amylovoran biosynthesis glycosyltransferase